MLIGQRFLEEKSLVLHQPLPLLQLLLPQQVVMMFLKWVLN